ncbi:ATP-binding protein [Streptococcus phocae]|uniref:DNA replication protein n=1 Tax=Streptococcus phocae TaxID=119224 RepID=A0A0P6S322_9STRE|nr:ATP-binding protein [Streptococcus phocae]KPJ21793.1 DNA replication protein [Streptococcus phocae]
MILGDENALDKIALSYQRNTKKEDAVCEKHGCSYITILKTALTVCPECHREEQERQNSIYVMEQYKKEQENKRLYYLKKLSIMDSELENASFDNFRTDTEKQKEVLAWAKMMANDWFKGGKGNIIMTGKAGRGKSHLAFSIIKGLSDTTKKFGLLVNVTDLLSEIKKDFSKESFWMDKLKSVEYLALDDLGAEKISDWSTSIIYSLLNKRTNTIITTNLTPAEIRKCYGERIASRIRKGCDKSHIMEFEGLEDERMKLWN